MEKEQKKKLYKMGLPIIMGTILLLGVSYAWLTLTLNGTKTNVLKAGTLSLTLTDTATNGINMQGVVPMLDEVGVTTSPYTFTLTNNGTVESEYTIYLDDVALDSGETKLPDNVIKYNLVKDGTSQATALLSTIGSNPNRVLDSGVIKPNETYNYDLRLWLDQDATIAISGQVFKGKIRVEASQTGPKEVTPEQCFDFDESTGTITLYKCGAKVWNGSDVVDATADLLPTGIDSPITDVVIPKTINGVSVTQISSDDTTGIGVFWVRGKGMGITSVVIPNSVTSIGNNTFGYNNLTSVVIPNSVTSIGANAFNSNQLTSIVLPNSLTSIGPVAFQNNQLTSITIPSSVTSIGPNAFANNQLTSITIPSSVTSIGGNAFANNQLTSITIPSSVTTIEPYAFRNNQLTSVIIKGKSSSADFSTYGIYIWGWADGYSDNNITWNG